MHFLVTAYDGKDPDALGRRLAVREEHMAGVRRMAREKKHLYAAAILDDDQRMIGSMLVVDFPSRAALDEWLSSETYVRNKVWQDIDVRPCFVPAFFLNPNA